MFVVVSDEREHVIPVGYFAAQEGCVEVLHEVEVGGAEDDVGEDGGGEDLCAFVVEVCHDGWVYVSADVVLLVCL